MHHLAEQEPMLKAQLLLSELLGTEVRRVDDERHPCNQAAGAVFKTATLRFAVEKKTLASSAAVLQAIDGLRRRLAGESAEAVPLLVVPYMGERGAALCREAQVSWLDLSGNAEIRARGVLVKVLGQPNQYKRPGRPSSLFAATSSRIVRWLLLHPDGALRQAELAAAAQMEPGYTSKIVHRMIDDGYLRRQTDGRLKLVAPQRLLKDWYAGYDFARHRLITGMCPAKSGPALVDHLAQVLAREGIQCALTGLAAAWCYTHHAGFRLATVYIASPIQHSLLDAIGMYEDARGANTWLVVPNDAGVFWESRAVDDLFCVHPLQAYLDLKAQPERSAEASQEMLSLNEFRAFVEAPV